MTLGTILALALISTMIVNGIIGAADEYRLNGWRKPTRWGDRNNGAF
jgi:hypothetical protein